ncbi:MAG: DUF1588 domain-containing protein, partial [Verrucomicrobiota bacterium]
GQIGDALVVPFEVSDSGKYRLRLQFFSAPDYGVYSILLNGRDVVDQVDIYSDRPEMATALVMDGLSLEAGEQHLAMRLTGLNSKTAPVEGTKDRYLLGLDFIEVELLPQAQPEGKKKMAHPAPVAKVARFAPYEFSEVRSILKENCFQCHGSEKVKGEVNLEELDSREALLGKAELLLTMTEEVEFREMPPEEEGPLEDEVHGRLLATLKAWSEESVSTHAERHSVTLRRMTRYEYNNAVRDLLGLKGDIYPLPEKVIRADVPYFDPKSGVYPEVIKLGNRALGKRQIEEPILSGVTPYAIDLQAEHGFNNRGDELSVSPILLEGFLKLARSIVNAPEFPEYSNRYEELFMAPEGMAARSLKDWGKTQLFSFINEAFRRPVSADTAQRFFGFFTENLDRHGDYSLAMAQTIAGVLSSPQFLYLAERQSDNEWLDSYELATRLSFFLWSSIPDESLLRAAKTGALEDEAGLEDAVNHMLESPKSQALSQNFARQWLRLDGLINSSPDIDRYFHYYSRFGCEQYKLSLHSMLEPLLLFECIMVEDRSIMLMVDSKFSWRSDEMQDWYHPSEPFEGMKNYQRFKVYQPFYKKRVLDTRRQGGVMTTAAVMAMTSDPLRTNPINRGAWMLTVMFNDPPPPPPDAVPEIEADEESILEQGLTLRERLVQHQENQSCASCHNKIDPLGFAFENYDAVGRWRDEYPSGLPIDTKGELYGELEFNDVVELKDAMLDRPEIFMRA